MQSREELGSWASLEIVAVANPWVVEPFLEAEPIDPMYFQATPTRLGEVRIRVQGKVLVPIRLGLVARPLVLLWALELGQEEPFRLESSVPIRESPTHCRQRQRAPWQSALSLVQEGPQSELG